MCSFIIKCWFIRRRLRVVAYESLKTKEKSSWVIPKVVAVVYGSVRWRELFITKFKSQFKRDFTNVVITRAGRLREWSQWELRLYVRYISQAGLVKIFITIIYLYFAFLWTEVKSRSTKTQKITRPTSSHLDRTSLVNKVFMIWPKRGLLLAGPTSEIPPSRLDGAGQSEYRIRSILLIRVL